MLIEFGSFLFKLQAADPKEVTRIRKALLEYCKQDTLAMVELWRMFQKMADGEPKKKTGR